MLPLHPFRRPPIARRFDRRNQPPAMLRPLVDADDIEPFAALQRSPRCAEDGLGRLDRDDAKAGVLKLLEKEACDEVHLPWFELDPARVEGSVQRT